MKTFTGKRKRSAPGKRTRSSNGFVNYNPLVKGQQEKIRLILRSTGAQARLTIGQPNDKYEQEADRVADQVIAIPDSKLQRQPENEEEEETVQAKPLSDKITPFVQRQEEPPEEEEQPVQAKEDSAHSTASSLVESGINSMRGNGQPLTLSSRAFFDPRMGADLGSVRIHTDSKANILARSINARAFTLGDDMFFAAGQYSPQSGDGKKLLAHELTHTIQQKANQSTLKSGVNKMDDSAKDRIQRAPAAKGKKLPAWTLTLNEPHYKAFPGQFRWRYKGLFKATDIDKRFFIVQWMKGSVKGCGKGGKGCVYARKNKHLGKARVKFNFPEWVVDAPVVDSAEYVGLTKKGNAIGFTDYPGVGQSAKAANKGRWPTGAVWKADMHFQIQVYNRQDLKGGTTVSDFKSINNPSPVKTVKWSWKGSYTIP